MKIILKNLMSYKGKILVAMLLMTISSICDLMLPTIMSNIVDKGIYLSDMDYIVRSCIIMFFASVVGFGTVILGQKTTYEVVSGFCSDLRTLVFKKVNTMSFSEMNKIGTASLVTRSTHDTDTLGWIAGSLCSGIITVPILFFGGIILSLRKDITLSLILFCFVPIILIVVFFVTKKVTPLFRRADEYIDKENDIMRERIRGIRVIRAFRREDHEHKRMEKAIDEMTVNIIKSNVSMGIVSPLSLFVFNLAVVLVIFIGAYRMENNISAVSAGDIFAIIQYITLITNSVLLIAYEILAIPQAKVALDRIAEVLNSDSFDNGSNEENIELSGDIIFDNVSFRYEGADESAVENVSFHINPGQKISIIGGTGSGKSTLVSLMLCFRMPTEGNILYDGKTTQELNHKAIRKNVSCVLQNSSIYSGTIKDNIIMGKANATEDEIKEAIDIAEISEFINEFDDGYNHELSQSGKNLSGGQKQRISIARAILKNAPIYIFDDSFSALDFLTEAKLRGKLSEKAKGHTQIVITQRVTSAMNSDVIFVMDNGKLIDFGTHSELLARCEIYQNIYASQTGGVVRK